MEDILNKMEQMELNLISKLHKTESLLIDKLEKVKENINSQKVAQTGQASGYDFVNPFIRYEQLDFLGGGACGEVFVVRDRETHEKFAMKSVQVGADNSIPSYIAREISLLYDVDHINIIKLIKVLPYKGKLHMLMQEAGIDLHQFLKSKAGKKVNTDIEAIKDLLRQLLSALDYLHERNIIHRDLKPKNILIEMPRLKICDLGSARRFGDVPMLTPRATTLLFMAPEMLIGNQTYGKMVDIWALGCIMFEMVEKRNPFQIQKEHDGCKSVLMEIFRKVGDPKEGSQLCEVLNWLKDAKEYQEASDSLMFPVSGLDASGNDLLKKLLALDPLDRITAHDALNHPFLECRDGNKKACMIEDDIGVCQDI